MEKIEQVLEKIKNDHRYLYYRGEYGNTRIHDFRLERGIITPERLSAFLENFRGQEILVIAPEKTALAHILKRKGYDDLAQCLVAPSELEGGEAGTVILTGGMLVEELLEQCSPENLIRIGLDQYFIKKIGNLEIMNNFQNREILIYQYHNLEADLKSQPFFNIVNIKAIIEKLRNRDYPEEWLKKIAETMEDSADEIKLFIVTVEKLRDLEYPFDENEIARYVACCLLKEVLEGQAEKKEDRKELIKRVKDFYANESVKDKERKELRSMVFQFDDPETAFLDNYSALREEAKAALKLLRESDEAEKLSDDDISYNEFFKIASKILAVAVISDKEHFKKLKDTDRLVLFIQDIYASRSLVGRNEKHE